MEGTCYGINDLKTKIIDYENTGDNISSENANWKFSGDMQ